MYSNVLCLKWSNLPTELFQSSITWQTKRNWSRDIGNDVTRKTSECVNRCDTCAGFSLWLSSMWTRSEYSISYIYIYIPNLYVLYGYTVLFCYPFLELSLPFWLTFVTFCDRVWNSCSYGILLFFYITSPFSIPLTMLLDYGKLLFQRFFSVWLSRSKKNMIFWFCIVGKLLSLGGINYNGVAVTS